jgi:hypothetical protein
MAPALPETIGEGSISSRTRTFPVASSPSQDKDRHNTPSTGAIASLVVSAVPSSVYFLDQWREKCDLPQYRQLADVENISSDFLRRCSP